MGAMLGIMMSQERKKAAKPGCGVRSINTAKTVCQGRGAVCDIKYAVHNNLGDFCEISHKSTA
jgi:hypothetical protein